nr:hypothetical protein GCM10020093_108180 [Planobispora longispora]
MTPSGAGADPGPSGTTLRFLLLGMLMLAGTASMAVDTILPAFVENVAAGAGAGSRPERTPRPKGCSSIRRLTRTLRRLRSATTGSE